GQEPPDERLVGAQPTVRDHPLERTREAEQAVEEPRAPGVGHEPDAHATRNERRRGGADADVARAGERETRSGDRAVDRGHHGLLERAEREDVGVVRLLERVTDATGKRLELAQVLAG